MELQQCRETLSGLEEAYDREGGETGVAATLYQEGDPPLEESPKGSDTESIQEAAWMARTRSRLEAESVEQGRASRDSDGGWESTMRTGWSSQDS